MLSPNTVVVFPGAPVVIGREKARSLLQAQAPLDSIAVTWSPADGWVSKDGNLAVSVGTSRIDPRGNGESRQGTYIAVWTRQGGTWQIDGLVMTGVARPGSTVIPNGLGPAELEPAPATGPARDFIQADLDFSALAGSKGAEEAFRTYAAPNAIVMGGGEPRRGPEAIGAGVAGPAFWKWAPVVGRASSSGDLGFTVGQAVIKPKEGEPNLSKYLTVWFRQPDGSVRFLTDGGNPRPKP
jgi:hypothetical protein